MSAAGASSALALTVVRACRSRTRIRFRASTFDTFTGTATLIRVASPQSHALSVGQHLQHQPDHVHLLLTTAHVCGSTDSNSSSSSSSHIQPRYLISSASGSACIPRFPFATGLQSKQIETRLIATDPNRDLALLECPTEIIESIEMHKHSPEQQTHAHQAVDIDWRTSQPIDIATVHRQIHAFGLGTEPFKAKSKPVSDIADEQIKQLTGSISRIACVEYKYSHQ